MNLALQLEEIEKQVSALISENINLKKENAELKKDNSEWEKASDKWKSVYELTNNQLTKAKKLLKWFVWYFREDYNNVPYKHKVKEADQFLKENEE